MAAEKHLSRWVQRNRYEGAILSGEFDRLGIVHNLDATRQIARWAYDSTGSTSGLVGITKQEVLPLNGKWRSLLGMRGAWSKNCSPPMKAPVQSIFVALLRLSYSELWRLDARSAQRSPTCFSRHSRSEPAKP
jgi:hypothetical protein